MKKLTVIVVPVLLLCCVTMATAQKRTLAEADRQEMFTAILRSTEFLDEYKPDEVILFFADDLSPRTFPDELLKRVAFANDADIAERRETDQGIHVCRFTAFRNVGITWRVSLAFEFHAAHGGRGHTLKYTFRKAANKWKFTVVSTDPWLDVEMPST